MSVIPFLGTLNAGIALRGTPIRLKRAGVDSNTGVLETLVYPVTHVEKVV
jgi:hypothetical protein